jgi:hypothetical protein
MAERFDFVLGDGRWRWFKRSDGELVAQAAQGFDSLGECIADARNAGFQGSIDLRERNRSLMI